MSTPANGRDAPPNRLAFDETSTYGPTIRRLLETEDPRSARADLAVSELDDMFAVHIRWANSQYEAVRSYFLTGVQIQRVLDRVVAWRWGEWDSVGSVLDFAAGYGRSTRMLATRLPPERITVGEIQPDALRFQAETFGVQTVQSHYGAADFPDGAKYDLIVVVSLFTHLPHRTFEPMLRLLWDHVADGGVLAFSTHNLDAAPESFELHDGIGYSRESEIDRLDGDEYGMTYTTAEYVDRAIREVCGADALAGMQRLVKVFGDIQDLNVVPKDAAPRPELVLSDLPPMASLDSVTREQGRTVLRGWAALVSERPSRPAEVVVTLDGHTLEVQRGLKRQDVAEEYNRPADLELAFSGWECVLPEAPPTTALRIVARCEGRLDLVLFDAVVGDLPHAARVSD